jgi:hypothetical protein
MTDAHDDDPLPALRAELATLLQQVHGAGVRGSWLGMALGRISSLRRQIAVLEQGRPRTAEGATYFSTLKH